jgi:hypothetical protein
VAPRADRRPAARLAQHVAWVAALGRHERRHAEQHGRGDRQRRRERQHAEVERHVLEAGHAAGHHGRHGVERPGGDADPERAAGHGQQQRLGELHLQEAAPRGAQRGAHAHLALA